MAETKVTPKMGRLNLADLGKGLLTAAASSALAGVYEIIANKHAFPDASDLKTAGTVGVMAGIGYLIKNLFTGQQIVISNPDPVEMQAVKEGKADVTITPK